MKRKTLLLSLLLMILGGANSVWADNFSPTADVFFRTSLSESTYSWSGDYPKTAETVGDGNMAGNHRVGMFVLQKYSVDNLKAAKSLVLHLHRYEGGYGGDAIAVWPFSTNDWSTSSTASDIASAVNTIVGLDLNTIGTPSNSPLVNGGSNEADSKFTFSASALQSIKNAATYDGTTGTFTLLLTNKTSDMSGENSGDRKFDGTGNSTEGNRPYVAVDYDPVVLETNSTITTYTTLNAAFGAIAAEGTGTISLYDDATITSRCTTDAKTITVVPTKAVTISSTLNNSIWILNNNSSGDLTIGSDDYQITIDGGSVTNSANHVEASGSSTTTIKNVLFTNAVSTHNFGIIANKTNGNLYLKNVTFNNCTANEGWGVVFAGSNNVNIQEGITFTGCTGYDFYLENKFVRIGSMTEPASPITVYYQTPALNDVILSSAGVYGDRTSWFKVMNDNYGLGYKSANADHILTEAYTMTMNAYGASTLILPFAAKIPTGVTAYTLNYTSGDKVTATEVTGGTLSANTPVLINADASTKYWFINTSLVGEATTGSGTHTEGALTGVYATTDVPAASYILWADVTHDIGFYLSNSSTVAANRAYLTADGAGVKAFTIVYDDETGVDMVQSEGLMNQDSRIFNLAGQRLSKARKGINIVNGKKYVVK